MTYLTFFEFIYKTRKNNTLLFFEFIYKTARKKIRLYKGKKTKKFEFISSLRIIKLLMFFIFYRDIYFGTYKKHSCYLLNF